MPTSQPQKKLLDGKKTALDDESKVEATKVEVNNAEADKKPQKASKRKTKSLSTREMIRASYEAMPTRPPLPAVPSIYHIVGTSEHTFNLLLLQTDNL